MNILNYLRKGLFLLFVFVTQCLTASIIVPPAQANIIAPLPPVLTDLSPNSGPETGGTEVTITGSNFISSNTEVFFGDKPGTNVRVLSDTSISVLAPEGVGIVNVTVVTPFGTTTDVISDQYTYNPVAPLSPQNFNGTVKKDKFLNRNEYILTAVWDPSPSLNVVSYKIYLKGSLVYQVPAGDPLIFVTCVKSRKNANNYFITTVNSANIESAPLRITLLN